MVLIVIDAQSGITNEKLYAFGKFKANVKALISAARQNNVEVIYVRHDDGDGAALHRGNPELRCTADLRPVRMRRYSTRP